MRTAGSVVAAAVFIALLSGCGGGSGDRDPVARGRALFQGSGTCATCHGADLGGTAMGPPLLDPIYAPDHHPDAAFRAAIRSGVQPHHWQFGPMPPLPHLDDDDIESIIAYVRSEQRAEPGIR
ncbi:MAG TPA: cytochrome c [Acidimicrobiales bacterium]|nr:cytochrome c [Acidimicrobiales bacterium]